MKKNKNIPNVNSKTRLFTMRIPHDIYGKLKKKGNMSKFVIDAINSNIN